MLDDKAKWNPYTDKNDVDAFIDDIAGMVPRYNGDGGFVFKSFDPLHEEISRNENSHFLEYYDACNFNESMWSYRRMRYKGATERTVVEPDKVYGAVLGIAPELYLAAKTVCEEYCCGSDKLCKICKLKKILDAMKALNARLELLK